MACPWEGKRPGLRSSPSGYKVGRRFQIGGTKANLIQVGRPDPPVCQFLNRMIQEFVMRYLWQVFIEGTGVRIVTVLLWSLLHGCATMVMVPEDRLHGQRFEADASPIGHLYVDNWGIYLFKYIPIVTGNPESSGIVQLPRLFSDTVRIDLLVEKVAREGRLRQGTILTDLRTRDRSYWLPYLPVLWLNEFEVSANLSRTAGSSAEQQAHK